MKTILAAIDFSPVSRRVVAAAAWLAKADRAAVVLVHVIPTPPVIANDLVPLAGPAFVITDDMLKAGARHLRRLARTLEARGVKTDVVCVTGHPAISVLAEARKRHASCLVLGSHGHGAIYDLVIGSTASGVLKRASCPVLVVPAAPKRPRAAQRRR